MRPWSSSPWTPGSHLFDGCVDGMVKWELLYSLIKVETGLGCSYVYGGIGSMQKRMTQNYVGVWVSAGVQNYEIRRHI